MNRDELVAAVSIKIGCTQKNTKEFLAALTETITEGLKNGEKVSITGFGTFEVRKRAARIAHNPHTGEEIELAAKQVPVFNPSKVLKSAVLDPDGKEGNE